MKPPKYDGTSAFGTFYAQFLCSIYNPWTKTDQLAHLKAALQKEAGQVLWDYGPEVTDSYNELLGTLKGRFGGAQQSEKFRMKIRSRRRKNGESLQKSALRHPTISRVGLSRLTTFNKRDHCL